MKKTSLFITVFVLVLLLVSCGGSGDNSKTPAGSTVYVEKGETYVVKDLAAGDTVSIVLGEGASIEFEDATVENSYIIRPNEDRGLAKGSPSDDGKIFWDKNTGEGILTPSKNGNKKIDGSDVSSSKFDLVHNHHAKDFVITTDEMRDNLKKGIILHREYYVADLSELEKKIDLSEVAIIQKRGHLNYNYWDYGFTDESGKVVMNSNDNTIKGLLDLSGYKSNNKKLGVYNALRTDVLWTEDKSSEVNGESLYIDFVNPIHMDDYIADPYTVKSNINVLLFDADELGSTEYVLKMTKDSSIKEFTCKDNYFKDYDCFTFGNFTPRYIAQDKVGQVISNYPVPVYAAGDEAYFYVGEVKESFIADFHINANSLAGDGTLQLIPLSSLGSIITEDNFREVTLDGTLGIQHYQLKLDGNRAASLVLHDTSDQVPYMLVALCSNEKYVDYSVQFAYHSIGAYSQGGISAGVNTIMPLISSHHRIGTNNDGFLFFYGDDDYKTPTTLDVYLIPVEDHSKNVSTYVLCEDNIRKYDNRTDREEVSDYAGLQFCIQNPYDYDLFDFAEGDTVQITIEDCSFSEPAVVSQNINGPASLENGKYYLFCCDDNQDVSLTLMKKGGDIDVPISKPIVPMQVKVDIKAIL